MRRRKQKRNIVPVLIAALALAAAVWLILVTRVFVIREIDVIREIGVGGVAALSDQEVSRMSGIRLGTRMDRVEEDYVRANLESDGRLAYVGMELVYPNTVRLTVRERTRDALILLGGKVLILDADAYVISVDDRLPEQSLPYVTGLKPSSYAVGRQLDTSDGRCAAMKAVLEGIRAQNAWAYVSEINVSELNDLRITSRTGITVLLGDSGNMNNKIIWMAGTLADLEARGDTTGQLDVSSGTKADYRRSTAQSVATVTAGYGS